MGSEEDSDDVDDIGSNEDDGLKVKPAVVAADTLQADISKDIEKQKAQWLQAPEGTNLRGIPLRCLLCTGKLLINSSELLAGPDS